MPKISVIMPVYNSARYVEGAAGSVLSSSFRDLELILVDDGSVDGSGALCDRLASEDPRVSAIHQPNGGVSRARNKGLDIARGDYVAFVDSDDFIAPDFLEKLYQAAVSGDADVAKGTLKNYDPVKGVSYQREIFNLNYRIKEHKAWFFMTYTSAIYRTRMLREHGIRFDERLRFFEDPHFSIRAAFHYNQVAVVDDAVYYYTDNPHSVTRACNDTRPIQDLITGAQDLMDQMDALPIEGQHYTIVFAFLIDQFAGWFQKFYAPDAVTELAASGFSGIVRRCGDFQACMSTYLFFRKETDRRNLIRQLKKDLHG